MPDVLSNDDVLSLDPTQALATSPPPTTKAPTDLTPQIEAAQRRTQEAIGQVEKSGQQQDVIAAQKEQALAPVRERQLAALQQPMPQKPQQQKPPPVPKGADTRDEENWLFAASVLGSLAGALSRRHVTNALAAFSGAMDGFNEGSKQKFDQNMKIWQAENQKTQEANRQALDDYRESLENRKLTQEQLSMELQVKASKYDDAAMAQAAKQKNSLVIAQLYDKQAQELEKMQTSADRIASQLEQKRISENNKMAIAQMRALGTLPGQEMALIDQIGTYKVAPIGGARGVAIMNLVAQKYPDYDQTKYVEKSAASRVSGATAARVDQRTEIAFAVGPEARNVRSLNVAIAHLQTLDELAKALGNSDFRRVNQLSNYIETELGYSMPKSFDAAKQIVSQEVVKAVVNNGGSALERQEAKNAADSSDSYESLSQVMRTWKSLLGGQMKGLQKQYESGTHKKDFYDKLEPETIKALEEAGVAPTPTMTPPGYRKSGDPTTTLEQLGNAVKDPYTTPLGKPLPRSETPSGFPTLPPGWTFESLSPADRS